MRDLHNKMEDERGGGASVIEAAKKVGLPFTTIEAVDRSGRAPDGGPVSGLPPTLDIVTPAFTADVGSDNDPLQINRGPGDSGYVWYDVLGITPSRERTLDEVKDRVAARWRDDQIDKRLRAKTDEMVEQLKKGGKLADLAQAAGLKVETAASFKRGATVPGMSAAGVEAVFTANKGDAGQADGAKPDSAWSTSSPTSSSRTVDFASAETKDAARQRPAHRGRRTGQPVRAAARAGCRHADQRHRAGAGDRRSGRELSSPAASPPDSASALRTPVFLAVRKMLYDPRTA